MTDRYKGYRMPKSIIGYAVRHSYRYKLSLRDISEMLIEQSIDVTYETIRQWCKMGGPVFARKIRQKRGAGFKDKGHIDEMRLKERSFGSGGGSTVMEKRLRFCFKGEGMPNQRSDF